MSERPINMSADQVQALLAGKTQHRVVLEVDVPTVFRGQPVSKVNVIPGKRIAHFTVGKFGYADKIPCAVGDRLWVREPHFTSKAIGGYAPGVDPDTEPHGATIDVAYKTGPDYGARVPWKSGALMPRRLSRLTLMVTDVRVQRLQEISEEDAIAEGFRGWYSPQHPDFGVTDALLPHQEFAMAWDDQHPAPEHQWEANPWVCALTFRVVHQNIDEEKADD